MNILDLTTLLKRMPDSIHAQGKIKQYKKGEQLISFFTEMNGLLILTSGSTSVSKMSLNGNQIVFSKVDAPEIFGEIELFDGSNNLPHIVTATSNSEVLFLPEKAVIEWLQTDFDFCLYIIKMVSHKNAIVSSNFTQTALLPLKARIINALYFQSHSQQLCNYSKQDLINHVNAPRRSVNRILKDLIQENRISFEDERFAILDENYFEDHHEEL